MKLIHLILSFIFFTFISFVISNSLQAETKSINAMLGLGGGAFDIGGEYEYQKNDDGISFGGGLKIYGEKEDSLAQKATVAYGFVRPHFTKNKWDFYISPAAGITQVDIVEVDELTGDTDKKTEMILSTIMSIGLRYEVNRKMYIGCEQSSYYNLFSDKQGRVTSPGQTFMFNMSFIL